MVKKKRVLAFGTFDLLHAGHLYYLEQAKRLGKELVVIVARDATVKKIKVKLPVHNEMARLKIVSALGIVDRAVFGGKGKNIFASAASLKPDIIALGYDQKPSIAKLKSEMLKLGWRGKIVRLKAFKPSRHKSSKIKDHIKRYH
jgi:FAD synthetase